MTSNLASHFSRSITGPFSATPWKTHTFVQEGENPNAAPRRVSMELHSYRHEHVVHVLHILTITKCLISAEGRD